VIDPGGRVLARLPENEAAVCTRRCARVAAVVYREFGDVFAIACCAGFASALAVAASALGAGRAAGQTPLPMMLRWSSSATAIVIKLSRAR